MRSEIAIDGMTCEHCEHAVREALEKIDGVSSAEVDVDSGLATFEHEKPVDADTVTAAVSDAGYDVRV